MGDAGARYGSVPKKRHKTLSYNNLRFFARGAILGSRRVRAGCGCAESTYPTMCSPVPVMLTTSERTRDGLRAALRKIAADGADSSLDLLDGVAAHACADARAAGVSIEQLIVSIKSEWTRTAAIHGLRGGDSVEPLARLVSTCIREYFR